MVKTIRGYIFYKCDQFHKQKLLFLIVHDTKKANPMQRLNIFMHSRVWRLTVEKNVYIACRLNYDDLSIIRATNV